MSLKEAREPSSHFHLPGIRQFLEAFAESQSKNEIDYFFISPVSHDGGRDFAYAYWMTGNSIVILDLRMRVKGIDNAELQALCDEMLRGAASSEPASRSKQTQDQPRRPLLRVVK